MTNVEYEMLRIDNRIKLLKSRQRDNLPVIKKLYRNYYKLAAKQNTSRMAG